MNIEWVTENDDGDEVVYYIPAKYEVCGRCEGHGTHLTQSIGSHAYSMEEFNDTFHDDEDREQYFTRGGIYDVTCENCHGKNVELVPDWEKTWGVRDGVPDKQLKEMYKAHLEGEYAYRRERERDERWGY